jgi:hypothetical protein
MTKRTRSSLRAVVAALVAGFLIPACAHAQAPAPAPTQAPAPEATQAPAPAPEPTQAAAPAAPQALAPEQVEAEPLNPAAAAFDVLIVRPFGLVVVPVGVAAFIPAALLTAPNGLDSLQSALDYFVIGPVNYVFRRPLGDF